VSVVVGGACAVVVLALAGPGPRRSVLGPAGEERAGGEEAAPTLGLDDVLVTVAAALRAGAPPAEAWSSVLGRPVGDVPGVADLVAACAVGERVVRAGRARPTVRAAGRTRPATGGGARPRSATRVSSRGRVGVASATRDGGVGWSAARRRVGARPRGREREPLADRAAAVVAAARTARELGAPLADVLEHVTASLAADAAERDDVEAALAGPRATAQVLAWLPLLGVGLGAVLGADPVGVLLGGGLGSVAGVTGLVLLLLGRRWTARLVARAERGG